MCSDLEVFDRYTHFDCHLIEAIKMREAIVNELNIATPIASFEGTLDQWSEETKDALLQSEPQFGFKIELPTKEMPKKEELTESELKRLHTGQISHMKQQFTRLLDNHRDGVASSEQRRGVYDTAIDNQFKRGFSLEGLDDYQSYINSID